MPSSTLSRFGVAVLAGVAGLAWTVAPNAASAEPYAYASNQISNLTITGPGGAILPAGTVTFGFGTVQATANFNGVDTATAGSGNIGPAAINLTSNGPYAFVGTGSVPDSRWSPADPGSFTGTRADAQIGAGSAASGGVAVQNVAEGVGGTGGSVGRNSASIQLTVIGTGTPLQISFTDLYSLIARTSLPGEVGTASISNEFQISSSGDPNVRVTSSNLADANPRAVVSIGGVPAQDSLTNTVLVNILTSTLLDGVTYSLTLRSNSSEDITMGQAIPEPASLALLGAGLLGLAAVRRRKAA